MSAPSDQPTNVYRDGYTTFTATTTAHGKLLDIRNDDYEEIWDVVGLVKFLAVNFPDAIMAAGWSPNRTKRGAPTMTTDAFEEAVQQYVSHVHGDVDVEALSDAEQSAARVAVTDILAVAARAEGE